MDVLRLNPKLLTVVVATITVTSGGLLLIPEPPPEYKNSAVETATIIENANNFSKLSAEDKPPLSYPQQPKDIKQSKPSSLASSLPLSLGEVIRLTGIINNIRNPEDSYAIIENSYTKGLPIKTGDLVKPGIRLTKIYADHIYVKKMGHEYRVDIIDNTPSTATTSENYATNNSYALPLAAASYAPNTSSASPPSTHRLNSPLGAAYKNTPDQISAAKNSENFADTDKGNKNDSKDQSIMVYASFVPQQRKNEYSAPEIKEPAPAEGNCEADTLPAFMCKVKAYSYVPSFMQGGETDVNWNQVPEYMKKEL